MTNGSEKKRPVADDGVSDDSVADLINEACQSSVKAIVVLIRVPMLITAECLKTVAHTVETVCKEFEKGSKKES